MPEEEIHHHRLTAKAEKEAKGGESELRIGWGGPDGPQQASDPYSITREPSARSRRRGGERAEREPAEKHKRQCRRRRRREGRGQKKKKQKKARASYG